MPQNAANENHVGRKPMTAISTRLIVAATAVLICAPSLARAQDFKAGIADPVNTVLAWWMADAGGFYKAQGLNVQIANMNGGSKGAEELQAGRLNVMHVGLSSVIRLNHGGGDLRLIGSLSNVVRFTFFSAPGVKSGADLKGGVVAVSTAGSESDTTVNLALERFGLKRSDVTFKDYGGGPARLAAVKSGEVKATMLNEPFNTLAREQGVNILVDLAAEQTPWVFSGITVRTSSLKDPRERDQLKRFLKATIEGNYGALTDPARAKAALAKELHGNTPKTIDIAYVDFEKQSPLNLEPSVKGAENILAQFPGSKKLEDYIDTSLLDEIKKEGFIEEMQKKYNKR
jgi:ABC-type nitrate/sulfonate/bicarbonate transport system substrate-binding protein